MRIRIIQIVKNVKLRAACPIYPVRLGVGRPLWRIQKLRSRGKPKKPLPTSSPSVTINLRNIHIKEVVSMSVNWIKDADEALQKAKEQNKPLLVDFSAAPQ